MPAHSSKPSSMLVPIFKLKMHIFRYMNQPSPSTHQDKRIAKLPRKYFLHIIFAGSLPQPSWLKDMKSRYPKRDLPYTDYSKLEVPDEDSFLCEFDAGKVRGKYINEEMWISGGGGVSVSGGGIWCITYVNMIIIHKANDFRVWWLQTGIPWRLSCSWSHDNYSW